MTAIQGSVAVLGAGIVGVCCALELQRRGANVILIDRKMPGQETSYGNAGILARSSLLPFNNPGLWRKLPRLLSNRSPALRYNRRFLLANLNWLIKYLNHTRQQLCNTTNSALDSLITLSRVEHRRLLQQSGASSRLHENGWLWLYRSKAAYAKSQTIRTIFDAFAIATESLDDASLRDLEPTLKPVFSRALWIKDADWVDNPGAVVTAYANLFQSQGGTIKQCAISRIAPTSTGWQLSDDTGQQQVYEQIVIALGAWSKAILARVNIHVPLAFERGYHMHYAGGHHHLSRPIYDTEGAYVLIPMEHGLRLTTGVELNDCDAAPNFAQLQLAERFARTALNLGEWRDSAPWMGRRPTFPDSRPMIGAVPNYPGLWYAFGHQHVGFCTAPGSAKILGALMSNETPPIDATPFRPDRF